MRFGLSIANIGPYADARLVAGLARDAEAAGWDGVFVWDHLVFVKAWRPEVGDPWTILAAVALATERVRFGPMVTPLPRRRPQVVARQTVALDRLSGGRLVFGVGLGEPADDEYGTFGEPVDARVRAAMLDEGLEVLAALWTGEPVAHRGTHYTVDEWRSSPRRSSARASPSGSPRPSGGSGRCAVPRAGTASTPSRTGPTARTGRSRRTTSRRWSRTSGASGRRTGSPGDRSTSSPSGRPRSRGAAR